MQRGNEVFIAPLRFTIPPGWRPAYETHYGIIDIGSPISWKTLASILRFVVGLAIKHDPIAFKSTLLLIYLIRSRKPLRFAVAELIRLAYLYAFCADNKIDVILAHHANERGLSALIVERLLGIPACVFKHGGGIFSENPANIKVARWVLRYGTRFFFCSMNSWKRAQELGMDENRATYVGLGVSRMAVQRERSRHDAFVIGFHGGLTRKRGLDNLIKAIAQLKIDESVQLLISGYDVEGIWPDLECLASRLGLKQNVSYLGQLSYDQYLKFLAKLDVMALAQNPGETGSLATCLEAQAAGVPVVTTGEGGLCEYVVDGVTGVICGTGVMNIRRGLEIAYEKCRNNQWNPKEFDRWISMHSWEQVASNVEEAFRSVILSRKRDANP